MPESHIPLLDPVVLRGVVEKFVTPENLVLSNRISRSPWPYPTAEWDIIRGSRLVGKANVPNAEAHVVPHLGRSKGVASFISFREKKGFLPTTLYWTRQPGTLAQSNAAAAILREVNDLNTRLENFVEVCLWGAMKGTLTIDQPDVQTTIDYEFATSHKPTGSAWSTDLPGAIVDDVTAWKRLVQRDGRVQAKEAFATEATMAKVVKSFATAGSDLTGSTPFMPANLMSDRMKDAYYASGVLPGFLGLQWTTVESQYVDDAGNTQLFCPDDALFLGNYTDGNPIELLEGPTADLDAPQGYTGKFSKTFSLPDPSNKQFLLEYNFVPIITRPEQMVYVANVG